MKSFISNYSTSVLALATLFQFGAFEQVFAQGSTTNNAIQGRHEAGRTSPQQSQEAQDRAAGRVEAPSGSNAATPVAPGFDEIMNQRHIRAAEGIVTPSPLPTVAEACPIPSATAGQATALAPSVAPVVTAADATLVASLDFDGNQANNRAVLDAGNAAISVRPETEQSAFAALRNANAEAAKKLDEMLAQPNPPAELLLVKNLLAEGKLADAEQAAADWVFKTGGYQLLLDLGFTREQIDEFALKCRKSLGL